MFILKNTRVDEKGKSVGWEGGFDGESFLFPADGVCKLSNPSAVRFLLSAYGKWVSMGDVRDENKNMVPDFTLVNKRIENGVSVSWKSGFDGSEFYFPENGKCVVHDPKAVQFLLKNHPDWVDVSTQEPTKTTDPVNPKTPEPPVKGTVENKPGKEKVPA
jgi:hypothetical protein